jgi:hypothetical protein
MERAGILQEGERYWLADAADEAGRWARREVIFRGYTACPAMVVVQDEKGRRVRCSRMDLYLAIGQTKSGCMPVRSARACISESRGLD